MNRIIKTISLLFFSFLITGSIWGQQKLTKLSQSIKVGDEVVVDLNTSYCNIIFDTWNKNEVEVEAYVEGELLSTEVLEQALNSWGIDIDASMNKVIIKTTGGSNRGWAYHTDAHADKEAMHAILKELQFEIADIQDLDVHVLAEMPELPPIPPLPPMPDLPVLPQEAHKIKFDYEAYKKQGDKYLKAYSKEFKAKYGADFAKKMEAWSEKFGEQWSENYEKQIEAWSKTFEDKFNSEAYAKKMEAWGERYAERAEREAARIEAHAERMAAQAERRVIEAERREAQRNRQKEVEVLVHGTVNSKVRKTIKIKLPKRAKLKVNVRHGEVEFANVIENLNADLAYAKLKAHSINGSQTSINASYSPIDIVHWHLGELNLNYVEDVKIKQVDQLILNARSSNISIDNLLNSAVIDGNIGDLKIMNIDDKFSSLNVILQNSNALISLPNTDYNLQYKGTRSRFSHPEKSTKDNTSSFTTGSDSSRKSIVVNAKYSTVKLK